MPQYKTAINKYGEIKYIAAQVALIVNESINNSNPKKLQSKL
jgi:hypothetical protein